jgi:hypothetical protein
LMRRVIPTYLLTKYHQRTAVTGPELPDQTCCQLSTMCRAASRTQSRVQSALYSMRPLSLGTPEIKFEIAGVNPLALEAQGGGCWSSSVGTAPCQCHLKLRLQTTPSLDPQDLVDFQSVPPSRSCRASQETWESSMLNLGVTSLDRRRVN